MKAFLWALAIIFFLELGQSALDHHFIMTGFVLLGIGAAFVWNAVDKAVRK